MTNCKSNIDIICPICGSEQTNIINNHLYSNIQCKDCQHEAMLSKEQNLEKFIDKALKKAKIEQSFVGELKNVIEYSYCPYWTLMKLHNKIDSVVIIKKQKNALFCHAFSEKSIQLYSKNILIPNMVTEKEDSYIINFQ